MKEKYEMVVGLEVHCQLATKTKLFCGCRASSFGAGANSNVCPVCTGQPGVLPVLNENAVELAFKAALALECRLADVSIFARKNYFYPDLPKAYQISQYEQPFSVDGALNAGGKRFRIHRIHMEEDAGKLLHAIGAEELDYSLVDFNRGGVPLIEIVSEPDMRSSEDAYAYLTALKEVIVYAGVSRCDMEKGEMRCDANVSVRRFGAEKFGTRAEIKNLNSFKGVRDALEYEFKRQTALVEKGERVVQETRLWDADACVTRSMRSKEEAHDYRYFPDPDLTPLRAEPSWVGRLKGSLGELPAARRERYVAQYGLSPYDAGVLTAEKALGDYFELAAKNGVSAKNVVNLITTDLLGKLNEEGLGVAGSKISAEALGVLAGLVERSIISSKGAKEVFVKMWETGKKADRLVEELGLSQVSDEGQVKEWVKAALDANPKAVSDLRQGKDRAIGAIIGGVMKLSKGKADPSVVNRLINEAVKTV